MRIALIGDVHLYRLAVWPWRLLSKRVLGQMNLWLNRARRFDMGLLPGLIERIEAVGPDLLLCTGDLTTTALDSEFRLVVERLGGLFERQPTIILPGNHDRYTFASARNRLFERYLGGYATDEWPLRRTLADGIELIGLDAAAPTWLHAAGEVPSGQIDRLRDALAGLASGTRVILMLHYPLGTPPGYPSEPVNHGLRNAAAVNGVLREAKHRTLVVHGHVHTPWCWRLDAAPNVVAINAGAPLLRGYGYRHGQGFWSLDVGDDDGAWGWLRPTHIRRHDAGDHVGWMESAVRAPVEAGGVAELPGGVARRVKRP